MVLMASWEVALYVAAIDLTDGGTTVMIWIFFVVWLAFLAINTSMAEMGSMYVFKFQYSTHPCEAYESMLSRSLRTAPCVVCGWTMPWLTYLNSGLQRQVDSITGYPSSPPENTRNSSVI